MSSPLYYPPTQNGLQKTLSADLNQGVTSSATLNNTTGVQNKPGIMIVDRIDTSGALKSTSVREWIIYQGTSGSTVTTLTRGVGNSTDQDHSTGAVVEFVMDITWGQAVIDALSNLVDPTTGLLDTTKVVDLTTSQTLTNKTLTSPKISTISNTGTLTLPTSTDTLVGRATTDTLTNKTLTSPAIGTGINDTNGNSEILLTATSSAVNQLTVANAATGGVPSIAATGSDSNIHLALKAKGSALVKMSVLEQDISTNNYRNTAVILTGWNFVTGNGSGTFFAFSSTFGITFTSAPVVVVSGLGYKDASDPTTITDWSGAAGTPSYCPQVGTLSTTGFTATMFYTGALTSGRRMGFSWIAIGAF